jgi:hypothetical protein
VRVVGSEARNRHKGAYAHACICACARVCTYCMRAGVCVRVRACARVRIGSSGCVPLSESVHACVRKLAALCAWLGAETGGTCSTMTLNRGRCLVRAAD